MQNVAVAKNNHVRISAQKVKIVIDLIRNKPVGQALAILRNTPKAASLPVEKLLLSAIANAENNHGMDAGELYVAEVFANQGPTMKRIQPRAQGRAFRILKRTSHITIALKETNGAETPIDVKPDKKAAKTEVKQESKSAAKPKKQTAAKSAAADSAAKKDGAKDSEPKAKAKSGAAKTAKTTKTADAKADAPKKPRAPRKKAAEKTADAANTNEPAASGAAQE
jgi:large subunit ribosomal protein L22